MENYSNNTLSISPELAVKYSKGWNVPPGGMELLFRSFLNDLSKKLDDSDESSLREAKEQSLKNYIIEKGGFDDAEIIFNLGVLTIEDTSLERNYSINI